MRSILASGTDAHRCRGRKGCRSSPVVATCRTLAEVVRSYITHFQGGARKEWAHYRDQPSLAAAIENAALCRHRDGKRHPHQTRILATSLAQANRKLHRDHARVKSCRSFDDLHRLVEDRIRPLHRVGPLTVYDIALRIGMFLGIKPKRVYLHRGTAEGARALGFR